MTFAYMESGKWVVSLNAGITTDLLKVVSLSGMCIPAIRLEYLEPAARHMWLRIRDHVRDDMVIMHVIIDSIYYVPGIGNRDYFTRYAGPTYYGNSILNSVD